MIHQRGKMCSSVNIRRLINARTTVQDPEDYCKTVSHSTPSFFFLYNYDFPLFFIFSVCDSVRGSDLACPIGLCNALCMWISSAALSQVFVRASCRQLAIYLHTNITMCSAELFLDVMLLCFVLQRLKIRPYLAGHGIQIGSVLFLIRACRCLWCLMLW